MAGPAPYRVRARNLVPDSDNKIHDDDVARRFGFSGALVPGVELFAYLTHPFVDAWGTDWFRGGRLAVRFRRPVYDGDELTARAEPAAALGELDVTLVGEDDVVRAVGTAANADGDTAVRGHYEETARPSPAWSTAGQLPVGPLGSVTEPVTADGCAAYVAGVGETLPVYGDLVHPGALLRVVNDILMQSVALGPWFHTASAGRFLAPAPIPQLLHAHGVVTECFERNGNAYVRYDALVLADDLPVVEVNHTAIYRLAESERV
jgi:acyl dehydratase